jgi:hypothetical protein
MIFSFLHHSSLHHSYRVLTRRTDHWSQLITPDNPRGYNAKQLRRIATAPTRTEKRATELLVMAGRRSNEVNLQVPINDDYGLARIDAMVAAIRAEYAPPPEEGMKEEEGKPSTGDEDEDK